MNGLNITKTLKEIEYDIMNCKNIIKRTILINIYNLKKAQIINKKNKQVNKKEKEKKKKRYRIRKINKKKEVSEDEDEDNDDSEDLEIKLDDKKEDDDMDSEMKAYNDLISENHSEIKKKKNRNIKFETEHQPYDKKYESRIVSDKMNNKMMERLNSEIDFVRNSNKSKQKIVKPFETN